MQVHGRYIDVHKGVQMKSGRKSLKHLSYRITKIFLFCAFCFSVPLLHGVEKTGDKNPLKSDLLRRSIALDPQKSYKKLSSSVAVVYNERLNVSKSGFFIADNLLVTTLHNFERKSPEKLEKDWLRVYTQGKRDYGEVLLVDPSSDLVIIKTQRSDYTPLSLGSDSDIFPRHRGVFRIRYRISRPEFLSPERENFIFNWIAKRNNSIIESASIGMRIGNEVFRINAPLFTGPPSKMNILGGTPIFSDTLERVIGVMMSPHYAQPSKLLFAIPIHRLKNLIAENKERLVIAGGLGFDRISPERVSERTLDFDVKIVEDMLVMNWIYRKGWLRGVPKDLQKAFEWLTKAAEQGYQLAQYELARIYRNGAGGIAHNRQKAFEWFRAAAEQGHRPAMYELAYMYYTRAAGGGGAERDFQKAFEWFKVAAKEGYSPAQSFLAQMYLEGKGVKKSFLKASYWARKYRKSRMNCVY